MADGGGKVQHPSERTDQLMATMFVWLRAAWLPLVDTAHQWGDGVIRIFFALA